MLVSDDWRQAYTTVADLAMLCDFGPDYWDFLCDERAVGNHVVLFAICGFLSEHFSVGFSAQVCVRLVCGARLIQYLIQMHFANCDVNLAMHATGALDLWPTLQQARRAATTMATRRRPRRPTA